MEEMLALEKNQTWEIVELPKGKNWLDVNECSQLSIELMGHWRDIRLGSWPRGYANLWGELLKNLYSSSKDEYLSYITILDT